MVERGPKGNAHLGGVGASVLALGSPELRRRRQRNCLPPPTPAPVDPLLLSVAAERQRDEHKAQRPGQGVSGRPACPARSQKQPPPRAVASEEEFFEGSAAARLARPPLAAPDTEGSPPRQSWAREPLGSGTRRTNLRARPPTHTPPAFHPCALPPPLRTHRALVPGGPAGGREGRGAGRQEREQQAGHQQQGGQQRCRRSHPLIRRAFVLPRRGCRERSSRISPRITCGGGGSAGGGAEEEEEEGTPRGWKRPPPPPSAGL